MANLTYRAERALLGALLRDPGALDDIRFLTAGDFASDQHREVFSAIAAARAQSPDGSHASFEVTVAFSAPPPGISVRYLQALSETCPNPANVRAYAGMVMESSLRRELLTHAQRLFRDAGDLHFEVGRFSKAATPGDRVQDFPTHLLRLAHAMWTRARTFDPGTETPDGRHPAADPAATAHVPLAGSSSPTAMTEAEAEEQVRQEEAVLADLIQHHWQNSDVLDWLPAEAFTAGPRRDVYEAITALTRSGQPVDQLTIEWHLASSRASHVRAGLTEPGVSAGPATWADIHGYVGLLAAVPIADGTATITGRALLERHARARAGAPTAAASAAADCREPAASPDRAARQAPVARHHGVPATAPPQSFGSVPARPPDLLEPRPRPPRQPGPQPRP